MIRFKCTKCYELLESLDYLAGTAIQCPKCKLHELVPPKSISNWEVTDIVPLAIAIYDDINESDIAGYESDLRRGGHEYEAALLYALRVSRNVPKFKKINTLFKRYELALHGPSGNYVIGLLAAKETANYQRTYDFLTFLYVNRFIEISQSLLDKAALTALQRKTQKAKINVWQKTYDDINNNCSRAQDLFLYSMRPIRSHKARCKKEILKIKRS